jgi:hypothetical protein
MPQCTPTQHNNKKIKIKKKIEKKMCVIFQSCYSSPQNIHPIPNNGITSISIKCMSSSDSPITAHYHVPAGSFCTLKTSSTSSPFSHCFPTQSLTFSQGLLPYVLSRAPVITQPRYICWVSHNLDHLLSPLTEIRAPNPYPVISYPGNLSWLCQCPVMASTSKFCSTEKLLYVLPKKDWYTGR